MKLDPTMPLVNVIPQDIRRVFLNLFNNAFWACAERSLGAVSERSKNLTLVTVNLAGLSENTIEDQRACLPARQGLPVDYTTNLAGSSDTKANPNLQGYQPTVTLTTKNLFDKIEIIILDNGNGMLQNIFDKIFQPFFATKPTGQGTGLGLWLAYDIVISHNGELSSGPFGKVETGDGIGSTFIIQLTPQF